MGSSVNLSVKATPTKIEKRLWVEYERVRGALTLHVKDDRIHHVPVCGRLASLGMRPPPS